jgi:hypothetical protein
VRSPSKASATTVSAIASAPPRRGRYHSASELTMPNSSRAAVAGSTSARRSPSACACLTSSVTWASRVLRRIRAPFSIALLPRTRSSSVTNSSRSASTSTLRRISSSSRSIAGPSRASTSAAASYKPSSAWLTAIRSNSCLPVTWW